MSSVYANVKEARGLHAADKGGTSDPYAVLDLLDADTGKPLKGQKKKTTKTVKNTLDPSWGDGEVTWNDIAEDLAGVSLRVSVFDADALSSEALGQALVPLAAFRGLRADKEAWYQLELSGKMKADAALGSVLVNIGVVQSAAEIAAGAAPAAAVKEEAAATPPASEALAPAQPPPLSRSRVWVKVAAARDLPAADKGGTSDPYAVIELVDAATGKPLKKPRKKKTKTVKKTLAPAWDDGEALWAEIDEAVGGLALRVTVFDADAVSSEALGSVSLPLAHYVGVAPAATGASGSISSSATAPGWFNLAAAKAGVPGGAVQVALRVEAAAPRPGSPTTTKAAVAAAAARPVSPAKKAGPDLSIVTVRVVAARELRAADKGGTSDPFATLELVATATGKALKRPKKRKTLAVQKTLAPVWNETIVWKDVAEAPSGVGIKVTVLDADTFTSEALGTATIPLAWGQKRKGTGEAWYPLAAAGNLAAGPAGAVCLEFKVESVVELRKGKPPPRPFQPSTWEDRVRACVKGGKVRLDLARLLLGDGGLPPQCFSPALGLGATLTSLNLKGNQLLALPPFLSAALPRLEFLVVSENRLTTLPDDLALLAGLKTLGIDRNAFEALPPCLFSASISATLVHLNAQCNRLSDLPSEVAGWLLLETLLLGGNALGPDGVPAEELEALVLDASLVRLDLDGNPCWPGPGGVVGANATAAGGAKAGTGALVAAAAQAWVPPHAVAKLLDAQTLFRSKDQRQSAMARGVALRQRLAKRQLDARRTGALALVAD